MGRENDIYCYLVGEGRFDRLNQHRKGHSVIHIDGHELALADITKVAAGAPG
ncbi:hypothetical protein AHiyo4_46770 [Arthrobacter sp. Hiyo4]|nr:hypothetical protein AHiyo4_46770 [Arthrobacter sp. Hiyo4]